MSLCEAPTNTTDLLGEVPASPRTQKKAAEANAMKLLPKLVEASRWSNLDAVEKLSKDIAGALGATHPKVAERLLKLFPEGGKPVKLVQRPVNLIDFREARHGLDAVVLSDSIVRDCRDLITEHSRSGELARFKLAPRHKILLYGPPGNGKTMLAEALAAELELPFLSARYSGLIDSYVGSTGKNLQQIFDFVQGQSCLILFDEFDAIGFDRQGGADVNEFRRVTNQLLLFLDQLPPTCVFVAATNAETLLDRAVYRRFDLVVEISTPSEEARFQCAARELAAEHTPGHSVEHLAAEIAGLPLKNLSSLVQLCQRVRRDLALNDGNGVPALLQAARASAAE